jgi:hypothetical protein
MSTGYGGNGIGNEPPVRCAGPLVMLDGLQSVVERRLNRVITFPEFPVY